MYGLNSHTGAGGDPRWTSQRGENVGDCRLHERLNIRTSDNIQAPDYIFFDDAAFVGLCQNECMDEPAFDRDKVAAAMAAAKPKRITQTAMAQVMGLPSQSAFSNIMKGKRRVEAEEARKAYEFLGIAREPTIQWVPIIGISSAGQWREAIHLPLGRLPVQPSSVSQDAFAVEVIGDSMDKLIQDGGHIIVDPRQKELRDGKVYLIQNADNETTVKAYYSKPPRFEPMSHNGEHKGWEVSERDFIVLGRIVMKVEAL